MIHAHRIANSFGYMTENEVDALFSIAVNVSGEEPVFVNIGAGAGTSSMVMREAKPNSSLFSIDISPGGPLGGLEGELQVFSRAGLRAPSQILGDSGKIAEYWKKGFIEKDIDLIFIDDGHSLEDISRDINWWLPLVKDGGVLAFHDYGSNNWPAVKQVVDETMRNFTKIAEVDTLIAFRKTHD